MSFKDYEKKFPERKPPIIHVIYDESPEWSELEELGEKMRNMGYEFYDQRQTNDGKTLFEYRHKNHYVEINLDNKG